MVTRLRASGSHLLHVLWGARPRSLTDVRRLTTRLLWAIWNSIPHGAAVRLLGAGMLGGLGFVRYFAIGLDPKTFNFVTINIYGLLSMIAGGLLFVTHPWRLAWAGRGATLLAMAYCVMIGTDLWPTATGIVIYGLWAVSFFREAMTHDTPH